LTVVGYSFRDQHINVYLSQWLNASQDHTLRVVNGANYASPPVDYVKELLRLQAASPSRVAFIPSYAGPGLERLFGHYPCSFDDSPAAEFDAEGAEASEEEPNVPGAGNHEGREESG
jgi:hypothetical protein